jgi:hypothetical protein
MMDEQALFEAVGEAKGHITDAIQYAESIERSLAWAVRALDRVVTSETEELRGLIKGADDILDGVLDALREAERAAEIKDEGRG